MELRSAETSCEICLVKAVQRKMSDLLLQYPFLKFKEEQIAIKRYLDLLKSKSEEIIIYIQIMLKVKNELAFARLDMERTIKLNNKFQIKQAQKRVRWLEDKLEDLTEACQKLFFETDKHISNTAIEFAESDASTRLKSILYNSTKTSIFKSLCSCSDKELSMEEKALLRLKHSVSRVLKHDKKHIKEKISMSALPSVEDKIKNSKDQRRINVPDTQTFNEKKNTNQPPQFMWKEKPKFSSVIDYHSKALDRLVGRLENIYNSAEDASADSLTHKEVDKINDLPADAEILSQDILPDINKKSSVIKKTDETIEAQNRRKVESNDSISNLKLHLLQPENANLKTRHMVYPRSPSTWCNQNINDTPGLIKHLKQPKPSKASAYTSLQKHKVETPLSNSSLENEKNSVMKRAAARVRAVAKIKIQFCNITHNKDPEFDSVKIKRIKDLVGESGICSENTNIAVDAAKALGQLKFQDESVIKGLEMQIDSKERSFLSYECAKSLLLLGHWRENAMAVLTDCLKNGNKKICEDILATIKKSPNAAFISKSSKSFKSLSNVLREIVSSSDDENIAFNAATCLGHLCVYTEEAKCLLLQAIKDDSYGKKADALNVLIKQINCKEDIVLDGLMHQISHAHCWKHRIEAAELLKFVGLRRLQQYDLTKVFDVLHELLWNHPNKEFRSKITSLLTDFGMRDDACAITLKRLENKNETVRVEAIIALATLKMKGEKELKMLLGIFELDSSNYVRIQVIKAFVDLKWNNPRVLRALKERQKGDDVLAQEASKALKMLTSSSLME
ncbi:uncharacterized protein LOC130648749 isoform X2 [Hydractinia symbiolongicarpus]|uniref:uncharacterized protein LOC130648749 isoform X2 n=1 Tax=Hydractinia symbiolongicarpus TaxID=13093 RepID=UPI00254CDF10|nr:uncharacterized protein LOC130648749 isoform X2 [Hydractinia symbiolongicarpus]